MDQMHLMVHGGTKSSAKQTPSHHPGFWVWIPSINFHPLHSVVMKSNLPTYTTVLSNNSAKKRPPSKNTPQLNPLNSTALTSPLGSWISATPVVRINNEHHLVVPKAFTDLRGGRRILWVPSCQSTQSTNLPMPSRGWGSWALPWWESLTGRSLGTPRHWDLISW